MNGGPSPDCKYHPLVPPDHHNNDDPAHCEGCWEVSRIETFVKTKQQEAKVRVLREAVKTCERYAAERQMQMDEAMEDKADLTHVVFRSKAAEALRCASGIRVLLRIYEIIDPNTMQED